MAQPSPGWSERPFRKPSFQRFVSQSCIFATKRTNGDFWVKLQTTPVPLCGTSPPDLRGARKTSNLQLQARSLHLELLPEFCIHPGPLFPRPHRTRLFSLG